MTITITCRRPADLVAAAIGVLGFVPSESAVMLTFGPGPRFHARIDLVPDHEHICEALLSPVLRHHVNAVAFIVFTGDAANVGSSTRLIECLVTDFTACDVNVVAPPLIVIDDTIHHLDGTTERSDWRSSQAIATLVADGRRIEPDRESLAKRLQPTRDALRDGPADIADLLTDLRDGDKRDAHLKDLTRENACEKVEYWLDITRHADDLHAAAPSALAGVAAWLSGDGALAWTCVDRAQAVEPSNHLAATLAHALSAAIDPAA